MHHDDIPLLAQIVNHASSGNMQLDTVRLKSATDQLFDGLGHLAHENRPAFLMLAQSLISAAGGEKREDRHMSIDVRLHGDDERLARIEQYLIGVTTTLARMERTMADDTQTTKNHFDAMTERLHGMETVGEGSFKLLGTVVQELLALRNKPGGVTNADIDNVAAEIDGRKADWAAKLVANTAAAAEPVPVPTPTGGEPAPGVQSEPAAGATPGDGPLA